MKECIYDLHPKKVFLLIGTNDICNGTSTEQIIQNIKQIIKNIHQFDSTIDINIQSIYPINATNHNKINQEYIFCRSNKVIKDINNQLQQIPAINYIDLYNELVDSYGDLHLDYTTEGLHISEKGYEIVSNVIRKYL